MKCPCGSNKTFEECCGPYISGEAFPPTAEALMRSRYTAYTRADINYIRKTTLLKSNEDFDFAGTEKWARESTWNGLKILNVEQGGETDKEGVVEFVATYTRDGESIDHHETSQFKKNDKGRWIFKEGDSHTHPGGTGHHHHPKIETVRRETPKVGRNDPCPCGSGKKFKKCCGKSA